jgi:hypothetical protein
LADDGVIDAGEAEWLEKFKSDGENLQTYIDGYMEAVEKGEELAEEAAEAI